MNSWYWKRIDNALIYYEKDSDIEIEHNRIVCIDSANATKLAEIIDDYADALLDSIEEYD